MISRLVIVALVAGLTAAGSAAALTSEPAESGVVDCVKGGARAAVGAVQGRPQPYYCELSAESDAASPAAGPKGVVDCVKGSARALATALLEGHHEPYACQLDEGSAETQGTEDPTAGVRDCVKGSLTQLVNWLTGRPYMPYACEF